jgi:hypothetical protein
MSEEPVSVEQLEGPPTDDEHYEPRYRLSIETTGSRSLQVAELEARATAEAYFGPQRLVELEHLGARSVVEKKASGEISRITFSTSWVATSLT